MNDSGDPTIWRAVRRIPSPLLMGGCRSGCLPRLHQRFAGESYPCRRLLVGEPGRDKLNAVAQASASVTLHRGNPLQARVGLVRPHYWRGAALADGPCPVVRCAVAMALMEAYCHHRVKRGEMMRLVFLYGPPAVGKLAVARELAARTGFKLLHNHLTIDLVASVFPFGSAPYKRLITRFRGDLIAESAREGVDLIFTFVYSAHEDDERVRELIEPVESSGGTVVFVRLTCATPELLIRVQDESRRAYRKLTGPTDLIAALRRYNFTEAVPFAETWRSTRPTCCPLQRQPESLTIILFSIWLQIGHSGPAPVGLPLTICGNFT